MIGENTGQYPVRWLENQIVLRILNMRNVDAISTKANEKS